MIPRTSLSLDPTVPEGYAYWTPRSDDLSDDGEGFGPFRDTWLIPRFHIRWARDLIGAELRLVQAVASLATDATEFDGLAKALETGDEGAIPERLATDAVRALLLDDLEQAADGESPLESIEMGIAGLAYALNAVGCWTSASCRGHLGERAWSPRPIIYLAADAHRVAALRGLVEQARCGFADGGHLLAVEAESIEDTMSLAGLVLEHRNEFVPPRKPQRQAAIKRARNQSGDGQQLLGLA